MPNARRTSVTIVMYVTAIAILVALLSWVWSLPAIGFASAPEPRPAATSSASSDPCDRIIGPARAYCIPAVPEPASAQTARALHEARQRTHGLVPATLAVAAAVGLVMVAGRREQ